MRLVLVGPPGCGKGTQAALLRDRLGLTMVGTGDMFREAIRQQTPVGKIAQPLLAQGLLAPDHMVNELVAELFRATRPEKFVMDGYPRTYAQAIAFDSLLAQQFLHLHAVIYLNISDDEVVRRISSRRCCEQKDCSTCFNLAFRPPKVDGVCDRCGGKLVLRDDDKEETIRRRLVEFHRNNDALIEHYRRAGILKDVPAYDPPETVYQNLRAQLPPE